MQPLAILFGAAFTAATAFSLGAILLRKFSSDPAVRFVTGASILSLLVFITAAVSLVYPATFLLIGAASIFTARSEWRLPARPKPSAWWLAFLPFVVLYFFNSMAPEISFDGSRYHLSLVGRYLREHGFHPITDTFYAAFPQGVEMLYLYAYAFGRHSAAAMVHFVFLLALAWQVYAWARRHGWDLAGRCAAAVVFLSPILGVDASSAYNDVAVAAIVFTLFNVLDLWSQTQESRLLVAAGLLAGFAFTAKYTAFLAVPFAVLFVAIASRRLRPVGTCILWSLVLVLPWLFKNYFWFWNPVSPFFNQWFPNPYVTNSFETDYRFAMASPGLYRNWQLVLQVTTFGALSGLIGPVFLLAPVALVSLRWPEGRRLLAAAVLFGLPFAANASTRFLIPAVPFVALAMFLPIQQFPRLAVALVAVHAVLSWPDVLRRYARPEAWRLAKVTYREALRIKPEAGFLESNLPDYGITRRIDDVTPPGSTILTDNPIPEAYTSRRILVSYQSAANHVSRRVWFTGFVPEHAPVFRARFALKARPVRTFRVVQSGQGSTQWTIHEIRAFAGGREVSRSGWRLTAHPFPWGVEAMVDDRPASFWMCGDPLRPGQFVQIDLPSPVEIETVVVEISPDQPDAKLALEVDGQSIAPVLDQVPTPPDLRRQAAAELKRRGIDYLLVFANQFGADDLRQHEAAWGVRQVTHYKGATLYQLP